MTDRNANSEETDVFCQKWTPHRLTKPNSEEPLSFDEVGEYCTNSFKKTYEETGIEDICTVNAENGKIICFIGNGHNSYKIAKCVENIPHMLAFLIMRHELHDLTATRILRNIGINV